MQAGVAAMMHGHLAACLAAAGLPLLVPGCSGGGYSVYSAVTITPTRMRQLSPPGGLEAGMPCCQLECLWKLSDWPDVWVV